MRELLLVLLIIIGGFVSCLLIAVSIKKAENVTSSTLCKATGAYVIYDENMTVICRGAK